MFHAKEKTNILNFIFSGSCLKFQMCNTVLLYIDEEDNDQE